MVRAKEAAGLDKSLISAAGFGALVGNAMTHVPEIEGRNLQYPESPEVIGDQVRRCRLSLNVWAEVGESEPGISGGISRSMADVSM